MGEASMGPHFFKCGNQPNRSSISPCSFRFNGAALFQVRKRWCVTLKYRLNPPLQWGRTFSSAETDYSQPQGLLAARLQWGRTFSSAETRMTMNKETKITFASMGPHFFKCGNSCQRVPGGARGHASMGPHFFKCGNSAGQAFLPRHPERLQWGRTFSSAET